MGRSSRSMAMSVFGDVAKLLVPGVSRRGTSRGGAGKAYENTDVKRRKGGKTGVRRASRNPKSQY